MVFSLSRSDARWSVAHLALLSRFVNTRRAPGAETGRWAEEWRKALGESEQDAVGRFLAAGLLEACSLPERLDYHFPIVRLKEMLRERRLKLSGRKIELAERLCLADAAGMQAALVGISLLRVSDQGRRLAEEFLARREEMRRTALEALRQRDFDLAISVALSVEESWGLPKDPLFGLSRDTIQRQLKLTFSTTPKILSGVSEETLEHLRIAAGMAFLGLGSKWLPEDFEAVRAMGSDAAVAMIIAAVQSGLNLAAWRKSGLVRSVKILGTQDPGSCPACLAVRNRVYAMQEVPELPIPACTSDCGCRCVYVAHEISEL